MKKLVLTTVKWKDRNPLVFSLFSEARELESLWAFTKQNESLMNRIYIGKVETIAKNIDAAFVRISRELVCFLPLKDAACPIYTRKQSKAEELRCGDEILVQVVKDAVKTKQPVLSAKLSVHGAYCVLTCGNEGAGVSKKIPKEQAAKLRALAAEQELPDYTGILLRTNASSVSEEELVKDIRDTVSRYNRMMERAMHLCAGSLVEGEIPGYIDRIKSLPLAELEIWSDEEEVLAQIGQYFPQLQKSGQLKRYTDARFPLSALHSLTHHLDELTSRQVWLKSGANIIIEQLETLTFIDINSAKNAKGSNLQVNMEAAAEIARQIRLRNISGMILIDFINMTSEEEDQELIRTVKNEIRTDPVKCTYVDMTGLGLIELTRQKKEKSLKELL